MFVILFALITILILYSSNSASEVFHYGSLRGRSRRPINLRKWSITDGYVPILGNKVGQPLQADPPRSPPSRLPSLPPSSAPLPPSLLKERVDPRSQGPGLQCLQPLV